MLARCVKHAADLEIHLFHHAAVGRDRAGVVIGERPEPLRFGFIPGAFPGPVRRVEMEADQKRVLRFGVGVDGSDGLIAEQISQVTALLDFDVAVPEIAGVGTGVAGFVGEVVDTAAAECPRNGRNRS